MHAHEIIHAANMPCTVAYTDTRFRNAQRQTTNAKGNDPQMPSVQPCMAFSRQTLGTVNGIHSELAITITSADV